MKPSFSVLKSNYPRFEQQDALFKGIGWDDLIKNSAFKDTCAIRISVALARSGISLAGGRMLAKAGTIKGMRIEPGQAKLSHLLKRLWGTPEVYSDEVSAKGGIGQRSGVVSFFQLHAGFIDGGHIDLVWPAGNNVKECARSCYFGAKTIWFWPLH